MPSTAAIVREIQASERLEWLRMRYLLWPGSLADHELDTQRYFESPKVGQTTLICEYQGRLHGFLELSLRDYAADCISSPVPYIEGWFVDQHVRGLGLGRALQRAAENWARAAGYHEIDSDSEIDNHGSIAAHLALGFHESERVVCFAKRLD